MSDDIDVRLRRAGEAADDVVLRSQRSGQSAEADPAVLYDGRRIPVGAAGLTIGRDSTCGLVLASGLVSPRHAVIATENGRYTLVDEGSRSGTYLNGERFVGGQRPLAAGDSVAIGDEILHFVTGAEAPLPAVEVPAATSTSALRMDRPRLTIGRSPNNDIILDHPTVSPVHAEIVAGRNGVRIKEVARGGTGVRVNGQLASRAFLKTGDEIAIGPYRLVFDGELLQQRAVGAGMRLDAEGVRFDLSDKTILHPTSLSALPGELVAVIGESGAGKTTLIKALSGAQQPTGGRVMIDGEPVGTRLNDIGYVPQDEIVHRLLTVREALAYAARLRLSQDTPAADRDAAVERVMAEVGLSEHADTRIGSLSGGQRKRAGVAVELIDQPGVLFLDEPTTGLDPGLEHRMMRLFRKLADAGRPVLLVTHATRSLSLCDKVAVMGRCGLLCFYGAPAEALEFFGVEHFDDLYVALENQGAEHWHRQFSQRPGAAAPYAPPASTTGRMRTGPPKQILPEATTLTQRYAQLFVRDRRNLRILAFQVPLLALGTSLLFKGDVFIRGAEDMHAGESAQLLFLLVTVATWFGAIAAAREIIKERTVVQRELAIGVRPVSYLASKAALLFTVTGLQTMALALIVLTLRPLHEPGAGTVTFLLLLAAWCGVGMGLIVSVVVRSEDQASSFIPLILVPQLLFGGAIVPTEQMGAVMAFLSKVITSQWAFAGIGNSVHMQDRIDEDQVFRPASRYGDSFFDLPPAGAALVLALFVAGFAFVLHRRLPAFVREGQE
jgi:ABC-type multidrug transport system ATPase subunit/pSer/pThr/pTyr-binding forkhead associated (FHA) protein